MKTDRKSKFPLELVLTEEGFIPEPLYEQPLEENTLLAQFKADRYAALYRLGLGERSEGMSLSAQYLYTVAETFFRVLTSLPELELLREKARIRLSDEEATKLLQSVPFVIGAEYVDRGWLERLFDRLNQIFVREIRTYTGTVAFYITEQSQRLRVPERIFFIWWRARTKHFPLPFWPPTPHRGKTGRSPMFRFNMP